MKISPQNNVKHMGLMKAFRTTLAYFLIFSLLWQNCLWAVHEIHILEEELIGPRIRTYNSQLGVIEPGTVKDGAVHNMFEDMQLLNEGGVVFKTSPEARAIYNRIHSKNSISLSGVMKADHLTELVFTNPGGLVLENPDFQNINALTFAAAQMALTNQGMAYGVDEGHLSILHTVLEEENKLKSLTLAGRGIHINESFLSPSEELTVRVGQYVQSIHNPEGDWLNTSFFENETLPHFSQLMQKGLLLDEATTLRSKALFLENLENNTPIHANGLLQSMAEDITIFAQGDVYLNRISAARNLYIKTTGRVFFCNNSVVGGAIHINAEGGVDIGDKGDILAHGPIHFANDVSKVMNRGKVISSSGITFDTPDVRNEGVFETKNTLDAKRGFVNGAKGFLKASSLSNPSDLLSHNLGNIEIEGDLKLHSISNVLKGDITIHGQLKMSGQDLSILGNVYARKGVISDNLQKLINKGKFSVFGSGLEGELGEFTNYGKFDLSTLNASIGIGKNKKGGVIRTAGHWDHKGDEFHNQGTIYTCGIHKANLKRLYEDEGTFYSPTFLHLQAMKVEYKNSHKSFLKDGIISARSELIAGPKSFFTLNGNQHLCFLQMSSQNNLIFEGKIRQLSARSTRFPLLDYFSLFGENPPSYEDFAKRLPLSSEGFRKKHPSLAGIVLIAERNINCEKAAIDPESGSLSLIANGQIKTNGAWSKAGDFNGDHASLKSTTAFIKDTTLKSLFGFTSLQVQEHASLQNSHILGGQYAEVSSSVLKLNKSSVTSQQGEAILRAPKKLKASHSCVHSQNNTVFIEVPQFATISQSQLIGKRTVINGGKSLILSENTLEGEYNRFTGDHMTAHSNITKGQSSFVANQFLEFHKHQAEGSLQGIAPIVTLSGEVKVTQSLNVQGQTVNQFSLTHANENSEIIATESYMDTEDSRNSAGKTHSLIAPNNIGFKGTLTADEEVVLVLKDMCIRALLNQTEAPVIKASLLEGNVILNDDLIINNTLHLYAKSLENKAKLTANKDFLVHMQTKIINDGIMNIQSKMALSGETLKNYGTMNASDLHVKAKHILSERQVKRTTIAGGYQDILQKEATMRARSGDLKVEAEESLQARGAKFEAKGKVNLTSQGTLYLGAQQTASEITRSSKRSYDHYYTLNNHKTQVNAGEKTKILSDQDMVLEGIDVNAGDNIDVESQATLAVKPVYDIWSEEHTTTSKGGPFKQKKTETHQEFSQTVVRNTFNSDANVLLKAQNANHVQASDITSEGSTKILSDQDKAYLEADKSTHSVSHQNQSKNLVWQSQEQKGHRDEKVEMLHIRAQGGVNVSGLKGMEIDSARDLNLLQQDPNTAWIKDLRKDPNVTWHFIMEEHKEWNQKVQGLTGPAAAVVALAIAIATQGTGASLISGLTTNATVGAMASAGFTSMVSQASISLINNQGNLEETFKDLGSSHSIRSLVTSVLSAGIAQGLSDHLKLPTRPTTFEEHLQKSVVTSGTSAGLSILIQKQDVKDALLQAAKGIATDTIGGVMANKIGEAYGSKDLNWAMHKLAHGALGAFTGAILGDDSAAGALAGALGGVVSEIIADGLLDNAKEKAFDQALEKASSEGRRLEYKDVHDALSLETQKVGNIGRLGTAFAAFGLDQDVNITTRTATNAIENNFIPLVMMGLSVASGLYSAYEVYNAYEQAGGGEEGAKAALTELVKQGVINLVGGAIGKIGAKTASAVLTKVLVENPDIAMVFGKAASQCSKLETAIAHTKVGQFASKLENVGENLIGQAKDKLRQMGGRPLDQVSVFEKKYNKKAVQNMTSQELAQSLANRAERKIPGNKGPEIGKLKHKYAERVLERYQESTGQHSNLVTERRFKNNREWETGMGLKDSIKPDLYNLSTKEAFDYKFGGAKISQKQRVWYETQLPKKDNGSLSNLTQIKPNINKES